MNFQRKLASNYTIAWVLWILAFGVIEFLAVRRGGSGDTLSEHVWRVIGTGSKKRNALTWALRAFLVVLFGWLIPHFFTGWLSG